MKIIPLVATPSQTLTAILSGQNCKINVYEKTTGVYLDLYINNTTPIITCVLCLDRVRVVRETYQGFIGDLAFVDTQGTSDPTNSGFGTRFLLTYLEASDL